MITDALLQFSAAQDLTALAAATATPSTNVLDFSVARDFGATDDFTIYAELSTLPLSGTDGATIEVDVQVSVDNATWAPLMSVAPTLLTAFTSDQPFLIRARAPFAGAPYRYMRLSYTASAALTAGVVNAGIAAQVPARHDYPRNFVA